MSRRLPIAQGIILLVAAVVCAVAGWRSWQDYSGILFAIGVLLLGLAALSTLGAAAAGVDHGERFGMSATDRTSHDVAEQDLHDRVTGDRLRMVLALLGLSTLILSAVVHFLFV